MRQSGALQWVRADREDSEIAGVICAISATGLIAWAKHIIPPPAFAKAAPDTVSCAKSPQSTEQSIEQSTEQCTEQNTEQSTEQAENGTDWSEQLLRNSSSKKSISR